MTLVVAQQKGNIIGLACDTGITKQRERLPPTDQVPKIAIIDRNVAVAFAGEPDLAIKIIEEGPKGSRATFRETIDYFLTQHRHFNQAVDFIICFNRPVVKISKISENSVAHNLKMAWLGDHSAFACYQKHRHTKLGPGRGLGLTPQFEVPLLMTTRKSESLNKNPTFQMLGTLRYVILDPTIDSVFGQMVAVNNCDGSFEYRNYCLALDSLDFSFVAPRAQVMRLQAELSELLTFAQSCFITPATCKRRGIAYHFIRGKLTIVYWGEENCALTNCQLFLDKNIEEFKEITAADYGFEWEGSINLRTPPPRSYGIGPDKWKISRRAP